jgi:hypothetical protein
VAFFAMDKGTDRSHHSLKHLFPNLNDEDLQAVEEMFYGYLEICWDMYAEVKKDPERNVKLQTLLAERKKRGASG